MFRRLAAIFLLYSISLGCTMWKKPPSGATGGEQLEKLFWQDVQAKNWAQVDKHVAETFAGTGPAGPVDRAGFLRDLQKSPLTQFSLSECTSQLNGADTMVTCTLHAQWAGQPSASSTLSVWQHLKKGWIMVAHAESKPAAAATGSF
jgi:hypothetical protein